MRAVAAAVAVVDMAAEGAGAEVVVAGAGAEVVVADTIDPSVFCAMKCLLLASKPQACQPRCRWLSPL